jgi:NAD(P)-dependent dehydrogenase (short-subunit alcohol dehydrogenase family)
MIAARYDLTGRTAMITGASSGIGAHLARLLAHAGANVVLAARRTDRIAALAEELGTDGACAVAMDVTDEASVITGFDAGEARFGVADILIANAGTSHAGRSTEIAARDAAQTINTNFIGVFLTAREAAKRMIAAGTRESEKGRILIMGSITHRLHGMGDAVYAASKAGVAHLGRNLAREWVRQGINVNTIHPGYIPTEIQGDWYQTPGGQAQIAGFHRRRLVEMEALDDPVLYFCSDASRMVTGCDMVIDDGQVL